MTDTLLMAAVAYDPKVVTIWEGFADWFGRQGLPFDFKLYSNYERQVEAHLAGHVHVAWNSPLAWLQAERGGKRLAKSARAIAMRDTDRDLTSLIVVRADAPFASVTDLRGRRVAVGANDSPQATLIPLLLLAEAGVEPGRDADVIPFDVLVGKHGDHVGGERDAARALMAGGADAACLIDSNHLQFAREGLFPSGSTRLLAQTPPYDHCNFTVFDDAPAPLVARFTELLLGMSHDDPSVRPLLDMEGLNAWLPGRTSGYAQLVRAIDRFGTIDAFLDRVAPR